MAETAGTATSGRRRVVPVISVGVVMSELEVLVGDVVPLISGAIGTYGAAVLSRAQDAAADATVGLGKRMLQRIWHRAPAPKVLEGAVVDLAQAPQDADALAALRLQVRKVLAQDPDLVQELAGMLPARGAVTASGAGAMAAGGNITVSAPGGVAAGVLNGGVTLNASAPGPTPTSAPGSAPNPSVPGSPQG